MTTRTPQTDPNHRAKHSTPKPQEQIEPNLTESFFTDEIQRDSHSLNQNQILQLQRTIGNQAVIRTMGQSPNTNSTDKKVQRKLEGELEKYK